MSIPEQDVAMKPKHQANVRTSNAQLSATTRSNILEAAISSLATVGYAGTTISSIAESVGLSRPALVYHFVSKHALMVEVINALYDRMDEQLRQAASGLRTPRERVLALFDMAYQMTTSQEQRAFIELLLAARRDPDYRVVAAPAITQRERQFDKAWGDLVSKVGGDRLNILHDLVVSAHRGMTITNALTGDSDEPSRGKQHELLRQLLIDAMEP